jgi:transcriptional regulator with XRE-family HTH domain
MSYFGINLKKIRVVKKLSQTQFADLFALTRSAVGAYEEGRAEAKIDKIIEIADYFNLSLDALLRKKLSVNEILHYNTNKVLLPQSISSVPIVFVEQKKLRQYIKNIKDDFVIKNFPKICIPDIDESYRAFEFKERHHFLDGEIIICSRYDHKPKKGDWFLLVGKNGIEIAEKISLKKKFFEIWRIENILVRNILKVRNSVILSNIQNKLDVLLEKQK